MKNRLERVLPWDWAFYHRLYDEDGILGDVPRTLDIVEPTTLNLLQEHNTFAYTLRKSILGLPNPTLAEYRRSQGPV